MYYARKRLSDVKQGHVCKKDIIKDLKFKKYIVGGASSTINATTSAVLTTNDRMLFSYAISNGIPAILDLPKHMILYKPRPGSTSRGGNKINIPKLLNPIISKKHIFKGGLRDPVLNVEDYCNALLKDPNVMLHLCLLLKDRRTTIYKEICSFFISVSNSLDNGVLDYKYFSNTYSNILLIGKSQDFLTTFEIQNNIVNDSNLMRTEGESDRVLRSRNANIDDVDNYVITYIINGNDSLIMYFCNDILRIRFKNKKYGITKETLITKYFTDVIRQYEDRNDDLSIELLQSDTDDDRRVYPDTTLQAEANERRRIINEFLPVRGGKSPKMDNIPTLIFNNIVKSIISKYKLKKLSDPFNLSFEKLNDKNDLFEKNICIFYLLFNLLEKYEISFLGYNEGRDTFYHMIDEGLALNQMPNNFIPNHIEFYLFLQHVLTSMTYKNLNTINYSLFEHCLFLHEDHTIYNRLQDIKSYRINGKVNKLNFSLYSIDSITLDYFNHLCESAIKDSRKINNNIFKYMNEGKYKKIYELANENNLSLGGFTAMNTLFVTKTLHIIESMESTLKAYFSASNSKNKKSVKKYSNSKNRGNKKETKKSPNSRNRRNKKVLDSVMNFITRKVRPRISQ